MEKKNIGFETKVILKRFLKDIFGRVRSFPLAEKLLQKGIAKKVFTILEAHNTIKDGLSSTKYGLDYDINNFILITETVETLERKEDLSDIKKELSCKRLNNVTLYPSEEGVYIFVPQDYEEEIKNLIDIQSKIGSEISSYAGISITTVGHVIFHTIFPVDTSKVINFKVKHIGENATIKAFIKLLENYSRTHKDKEEIVNILSKSQIYKWFTQEFQVMIQKKYLKKSFSKTLTLNEKKNIFFELLDDEWHHYVGTQSATITEEFKLLAKQTLSNRGYIPMRVHTHPKTNELVEHNRIPTGSDIINGFTEIKVKGQKIGIQNIVDEDGNTIILLHKENDNNIEIIEHFKNKAYRRMVDYQELLKRF